MRSGHHWLTNGAKAECSCIRQAVALRPRFPQTTVWYGHTMVWRGETWVWNDQTSVWRRDKPGAAASGLKFLRGVSGGRGRETGSLRVLAIPTGWQPVSHDRAPGFGSAGTTFHLIARLVENAALFGAEAVHALAADLVQDVIDTGSAWCGGFRGFGGLEGRFRQGG